MNNTDANITHSHHSTLIGTYNEGKVFCLCDVSKRKQKKTSDHVIFPVFVREF